MPSSKPRSETDAEPRRNTRVYGRRIGRPLRKQRQELFEQLLPRLRVTVADGETLDPRTLFPGSTDVWLEIGFGYGEHLAWQAAHNPTVGIIGSELFINGLASMVQHVSDQNLGNVRIGDTDAFRILSALAPQSIGRAFLLFPDPWPKVRHHRRRFIRDETLTLFARVLRDGAELRVATDHLSYLGWALTHLLRHPDFEWTAERPDDWRVRPPTGRKPVTSSGP